MLKASQTRCLKLTIEYDGTDFHGWQRQASDRTVQQVLEDAAIEMLGEEVIIIGAGRTDAGVHARGQVASVNMSNQKLTCRQFQQGINRLIGQDVYVKAVVEAPPGFHARFSAVGRRYSYTILRQRSPLSRRYAWTPRLNWDDDKAATMTGKLLGKNSFMSFSRAREGETSYISNLSAIEWRATTEGVRVFVSADRFFHQMVRGLVGALFDHARGYLSEVELLNLINHPTENAVVRFAPPCGLVLEGVDYE